MRLNKKIVTVSLASTLALFSLAGASSDTIIDNESSRDLQTISNRVRITTPLLEYPDDLQIDFNVNLKCGACIRGGYIFCVNGFEEDLDLWNKTQRCCKDLATCPEVNLRAWSCSNVYTNNV